MRYRLQDVPSLRIYQYHFLDDLTFTRPPADAFPEMDATELQQVSDAVHARFLEAGWEGDGAIGVIWLPPFVDVGEEDTHGHYCWHVKQSNNGTSWIASKGELPFERLREQNEKLPWRTHVPVAILHSECSRLMRHSEKLVATLRERLAAMTCVPGELGADIAQELVIATQGSLVSELQEFMDDCYLLVLIDVIEHGNPHSLHISKLKATLDPLRYQPAPDDPSADDDVDAASDWFTITGFIKDIWHSYKFEPFKAKAQMLFSAFGYKIDDSLRSHIAKHVALRNCIQHHQGQLTADALSDAGVKEFVVLVGDGKEQPLKAWSRTRFSVHELDQLCMRLVELATTLDKHVSSRVPSAVWVPRSDVNERLTVRR